MTLCQAAACGDIAELTRILTAGGLVSARDEYGYQAIHHAAFHAEFGDNLGVLRILLLHGADPNGRSEVMDRDCAGVCPLHIAAHGASLEFVQTLLVHGTDIHAESYLGPPPGQTHMTVKR